MDPLIVWSQTFALGHADLDQQHRALVDAINAICGIGDTGERLEDLEPRLIALRKAVEEHLRTESAILWELSTGTSERLRKLRQNADFQEMLDAAHLADHFADHDRTLAEIDAIIAFALPASGGDGKLPFGRLKTWFIDHSIKYDARLKPIFQAM
jgi:hemerythrin